MLLFLTGFMGSGKTTLGKQLADEAGYNFVDTDQLFEDTYGHSIKGYFETYGEEAFRKKEAEILRSLRGIDETVVATGGGTPCHFDNMEWMLHHGTVVYLRIDSDELYKRLYAMREQRPILNNTDDVGLKRAVQFLLEQREPFYNRANYTFEGPDIPVETVINTVFTTVDK